MHICFSGHESREETILRNAKIKVHFDIGQHRHSLSNPRKTNLFPHRMSSETLHSILSHSLKNNFISREAITHFRGFQPRKDVSEKCRTKTKFHYRSGISVVTSDKRLVVMATEKLMLLSFISSFYEQGNCKDQSKAISLGKNEFLSTCK